MESEMKWINPCGKNLSGSTTTDNNYLVSIARYANSMLTHTDQFKEKFILKLLPMFKTFQEAVENYKDTKNEWVPKVPKMIGETVPQEHLQKLEVNETLLNIYKNLQTLAVGMEQVLWSLDKYGEGFQKEFNTTQYQLKLILCGLQEYGLVTGPDVTRDAMPVEERNMDKTRTRESNFLILRDYINLLQYVHQVVSYFGGTIASQTD